MKKVSFLNTKIHNLTMQETLQHIENVVQNGKQLHHVSVNAAKIVAMQKDLQLRESVNSCDLINADGQSVVWASRFLGKPLIERVAGIDLMTNIVELAYKKKLKIFFFGAKEEVVKKTVEIYSKQYDPSIIAGYRNGYFKKEEDKDIAKQISESGANILFVGISSPTKENFLYENKILLEKVNFIMGVGGSFDVVSGKVKRAPNWMQKKGLEWLYRLIQEPRRMWKRYLIGNLKFVYLVFNERILKKGNNI